MNTITLLGIDVQIREAAVEPDRPFIMILGCEDANDAAIRPSYPLWLQAIKLPNTSHKEESKLLTRMLLNTMVWNKAISHHQRLDCYRDLPGAKANMIGLYEQLFAERKNAGVFADIPPGDDGEAYLIRSSGNLYSVFADSVGAAKQFCLRAMALTHHRQIMEQEGCTDAYRSALERLM